MHPLFMLSMVLTMHRTSPPFVKKKAALTLLRLYRKHPDVVPVAEWALRIVSIMDDPNLVRTLLNGTGLDLQVRRVSLCP